MNSFIYFQGGQRIPCQLGGLETRKTLLAGALKPEKRWWVCVDQGKFSDVHSLECWNARYGGSCRVLSLNKQWARIGVPQFTISLIQTKVTNKDVWQWQLGFWLDSGICYLALIQRNTSASTWQRGLFWLLHHPLKPLPNVRKVGPEWEKDNTAPRYKENPQLSTI